MAGLHNIGDWHDHCIWVVVACRVAEIEHLDVVVKCAKRLEQVHIGEQMWVKAKVRW